MLSRVTPLSRSEERSIVELQAEAIAKIKKKIHGADARRKVHDEIDSTLVPFVLATPASRSRSNDLDRLTELNQKVQANSFGVPSSKYPPPGRHRC